MKGRHSRILALIVAMLLASCSGVNEPVTLTLLAHDSFTPSEGIFDQFTADTGIRVQVVRSGDAGTLVTKAVLVAGNPEADVLWGVDNTLLSRTLDADVFLPYVSVHRDDLDAAAVALAPNGEVTPVDSGDVCINYDKAWFAERSITPPLTLQALTSATYKNLLVVPNPVSSSPGLAFLLATIAESGDGWQQWWQSMRDNGVLVVESWSDAYYGHFTAASDGERPLVVSYATSPPAEVIFADPRPSQAPTAVAALTCFRQ
ncbi:MAG: thiamine ABC transporter substrate binding subunit, partial [Actinomycetota bacterium]